jgi:translocation and assembly module TamA
VAGRFKAGQIFGALVPEVPASRRFYAGGGGSVRGYAYQAIGPRLSDNTPQGGVSLVETRWRCAIKLHREVGRGGLHRRRRDRNREDSQAGGLRRRVGFGVRYDLGFGPIRADIAVPMGKRDRATRRSRSISASGRLLTDAPEHHGRPRKPSSRRWSTKVAQEDRLVPAG